MHTLHIFRAYYRNAFIKQYEKFSTYLRNEACSNNLADFGLNKGLDRLAAVRDKLLDVTDRFAAFQAQCLNVHVEFPLLQRLALPIAVGTAKYPGIEIHSTRIIRLMEALLHGGTVVSGWSTRQIHEAILTAFQIGANHYGLDQLRYDLRKLKAHGLLARHGKRYAYRRQRKEPRSRPCSSFFTSNSAARSPTASFIIDPRWPQDPTASSKPPSIKRIIPSKTSFNCSKLHDICCRVFVYQLRGKNLMVNSRSYSFQRRMISVALMPPKPNELDRAISKLWS